MTRIVLCAFLWTLSIAGVGALTSGKERTTINLIVLHATGGPVCDSKTSTVKFTPAGTAESIKKQLEDDAIVGIHYIVGTDGRVLASIPENQVANHAVGYNQNSIGIELVNAGDGKDRFTTAQLEAATTLVSRLVKKYELRRAQVKQHSELDNSKGKCGTVTFKRKQDPGPLFPFDAVLNAVFKD